MGMRVDWPGSFLSVTGRFREEGGILVVQVVDESGRVGPLVVGEHGCEVD